MRDLDSQVSEFQDQIKSITTDPKEVEEELWHFGDYCFFETPF
jgi:hypothetical protein